MHEGDLDTCYNFNKMATQIRPRFAVPHSNMGFVHLQKHEVDKAVACFRRAISFDPQFIQAHASLGSAYLMQGDLVECEKQSNKALELEPNFGPAYNNLGLVCMEREDFEKAAEYFSRAEETGFEVPAEIKEELKAKLGEQAG
jgi:Tfp pilus assembly protein PilF